MIPRWMHWAYARALGYFWLPCPRCGRMFGGHEAHGGTILKRGNMHLDTGEMCQAGEQVYHAMLTCCKAKP